MAKLFGTVTKFAEKNLPTILTVGSGICFTGATIVSWKNGTKAHELMKGVEKQETKKKTAIAKAKVAAPYIIPPAILWVTGCTMLYFANKEHLKRTAAFATGYLMSEKRLTEYKEKVAETFGVNEEAKVETDISQDKIVKNPPVEDRIIHTGLGDYLCMDGWSGRYFRSDINKIQRAINELNAELITSQTVCLNDLYVFLGLPTLPHGEDLGWNVYTDKQIDIRFDYGSTEDGTPCLVLRYDCAPRFEYDEYYSD